MKKPSTHPGRVFLALLAASFLGCTAGVFALPMLGGNAMQPPDIGAFIEFLFVVWIVTLPISIPFGAATHWVLVRLKFWPVTAYTIAGMLLGPVSLIVWDMVMNRHIRVDWLAPELAWLGVIVGGSTALAFRLLVHKTSDTDPFPPEGTRPY